MKTTPLIVLFLVAVTVRQSASKYTTLLEDEQQQQQDNEPPVPDKAKPTTVSYGKLIYDPQTKDQQSQTLGTNAKGVNVGTGGPNGTTNGGTGSKDAGGGATVFSQLYSKVTAYLPFLAQLTNLRQPSGTNSTTSSDSELHAKANVSVSMVRDVSSRQAGGEGAKDTATTTLARGFGDGNGMKNEGENRNSDTNGNSNNDNIDVDTNQDNQQQNNDKQLQKMKVKISIGRSEENGGNQVDEQQDRDDNEVSNHDEQQDAIGAAYDKFVGQFGGGPIGQLSKPLDERQRFDEQLADIKSGGQKRDQQYILEDNNDRNSYYNDQANEADLDVDMSQMVPVAIGLGNLQRFVDQTTDQNADDDQQQQQRPLDLAANRYNMMRQSNLVVPASSSDDILTGATSGSTGAISRKPESLLGRYIYAPTQHYYLNPVIPQPMAAGQQSHLMAGEKHLQPGDHIYSSYGPDKPMKAAYSYSKDHNSIGDKQNDLYFLIMVGGFCMMATTVVLAAGLFAYRIQQSRKSSQDTGYPTYGVVGPNNMSGKCGAASFVGGYFTGPLGGGCDSNKSGSARHLADMYCSSPNGAGGSDSGLNSLDKSSSNKKASSVSSLNEFHQSATSRAAPSNFMAAASQDAARMYHYQHQKQQMIISDRNSGGRQTTASDLDSEDENDDGSYTVYECPGLASAHEMEIKNPLFNDDQSP